MSTPVTKPVHAMTPPELADAGIPVEVALRARIVNAEALIDGCYLQGRRAEGQRWIARKGAYRDALAIIEAKPCTYGPKTGGRSEPCPVAECGHPAVVHADDAFGEPRCTVRDCTCGEPQMKVQR